MQKKNLLLFILFLLLPVCTTTSNSIEVQKSSSSDKSKAKLYASSLLWKVASNEPSNLKSNVILFGTIHGGVDPKKDLDPQLYQEVISGIKKADTIYFEIDLSQKINDNQMSTLFYSGKETLEEKLKAEDWLLLKKQLSEIPSQSLNKMRPITVFMSLMQKGLQQKSKNKSSSEYEKSIDAFVYEEALVQNKTLGFLETPDFQLNLMSDLITIDDLSELINSRVEFDDHLGKLIEIYKSQNIEKIYQSFELEYKGFEKSEKWLEELVIKRNRAWIAEIEKCLNNVKQSCFFAFGAGHLGGPEGVLALLEKNNWRVKPYQNRTIE